MLYWHKNGFNLLYKRLEKERYRAMSVGEKAAYRKEIKEEKREQKFLKRKRKRKMG